MGIQAIRQLTESIYQARRRESQSRLAAAREAYLAKRPALKEAFDEVQEKRFALLAALAEAGSGEPGMDIRKASAEQALSAAEASLAARLRAAADSGDPFPRETFFCPVCRDTGRVPVSAAAASAAGASDNPEAFGRSEAVSASAESRFCPSCFPATIRRAMEKCMPGLIPDERFSFARFNLQRFSPELLALKNGKTSPRLQMEHNLAVMKQFAETFPNARKNFYFTGKTGTGKTFLASCVVNALLDRGVSAVLVPMLRFEEITARLRTKQRSFSVRGEELSRAEADYDLMLDAELLVLDDFGVHAGLLTEPVAELLMLLQERRARGGLTIITSNIPLRNLSEVYDERLLSRLLERFEILPFLGEDLRLSGRRG